MSDDDRHREPQQPEEPSDSEDEHVEVEAEPQDDGDEFSDADSSDEEREDDREESEEGDDDEDEEGEAEDVEGAEGFDMELPARHSYLGESSQVTGRTILEEDVTEDILLLHQPGIALLPGQTVPLTIFHPVRIDALKRILETTKTFGFLLVRQRRQEGHHSISFEEVDHGTTAEIFEFRDPPVGSNEVGFKIKVKGRQRFRVIKTRQQADGNRIGTVKILREIDLPDPLYSVRLRSRDHVRPTRSGFSEENDESVTIERKRRRTNSFRASLTDFFNRFRHTSTAQEQETVEEDIALSYPPPTLYSKSKWNHLRTCVYGPPITPFPNWVFEMYDARILVEKVHHLLGALRLFSQSKVSIPSDPVQLSFWLGANLPFDDSHRLKLLEMNCAVQRLRYELALLKRCQRLHCRSCNVEIARQEDIFSMSQEGPQNAYVNPGGVVHETLTLYKAKSLKLVGRPSTEYSWFPGYAWTICECQSCESHMGWKFTATNRKLTPKKFWGLSRRSIKSNMVIRDDGQEDEVDDEEDATVGVGGINLGGGWENDIEQIL